MAHKQQHNTTCDDSLNSGEERHYVKSSLLLNSHHQHIKTLLNPQTPDNINKVRKMMGDISEGGVKVSRQLKNETGYSPQQAKKMVASGKNNFMSDSFQQKKAGLIKSPQSNGIGSKQYTVNQKGIIIEESKVLMNKGTQNHVNSILQPSLSAWTTTTANNQAGPKRNHKGIDFRSPTFNKLRNNGMIFSEVPPAYPIASTSEVIPKELGRYSQHPMNFPLSNNNQLLEKIKIRKNDNQLDRFANTLQLREFSKQLLAEKHHDLEMPFVISGDSLPTLNAGKQQPSVKAGYQRKKHSARNDSSLRVVKTAQKRKIQQQILIPQVPQQQIGQSSNPFFSQDSPDKTPKIYGVPGAIQLSQTVENDTNAMVFSPSQPNFDNQALRKSLYTNQAGTCFSRAQNDKQNLNIAKSLPSLSSQRGTTATNGQAPTVASTNSKSAISSMISKHMNALASANGSQMRERASQNKDTIQAQETPMFIQSFEQNMQQQIQAPHPQLSHITMLDVESFLHMLRDHHHQPQSRDHSQSRLSSSQRKSYSQVPSQRFRHVVTAGGNLAPKSPSSHNGTSLDNHNKQQDELQQRIEAFMANIRHNVEGNSMVIPAGGSSFLSSHVSNNNNGTNSAMASHDYNTKTRHFEKKAKYMNNQTKFTDQGAPIQVLSTQSLIAGSGGGIANLLLNEKKNFQAQIIHQQNKLRQQKQGAMSGMGHKSIAGFKININGGGQGSQSTANIGNHYGSSQQQRNVVNIANQIYVKNNTEASANYHKSSSIHGRRKDLIDRPHTQQRIQNHQSNKNSTDMERDQIFMVNPNINLNLMQPDFDFNNYPSQPVQREHLGHLIKDIIIQRNLNHKQHLQKIDAMRRPSTGAPPETLNALSKPQNNTEQHHTTGHQPYENKNQQQQYTKVDIFQNEDYLKLLSEWAYIRQQQQMSQSNYPKDYKHNQLMQIAEQLLFPLEKLQSQGCLTASLASKVNNTFELQDQLPKRNGARLFKNRNVINTNIVKKPVENGQQAMLIRGTGELLDRESNVKNSKIYPPTLIEIVHVFKDDQTGYEDHPINKAIGQINSFIHQTFRTKVTLQSNAVLDYLKPELKKFNLPVPPKNMPLVASYLRSKEFLGCTKYQLMTKLCNAINQTNDFDYRKYEQANAQQFMKYFIGRGNNDHIVRVILKQRFSGNWSLKDRAAANGLDPVYALEETGLEDVNFIWTQVKRQHIVNQFESYTKKIQDQENAGGRQLLSLIKSLASDSSTNNNSTPTKKEAKLPQLRLYGKLESNFHLSNKKALFANMKLYYEAIGLDPFDVLPLTFHIKNGLEDQEYFDFKSLFEEFAKNTSLKNVWIIKPGENTNRGYGIQVCSTLKEIEAIIKNCNSTLLGYYSTFIVQKYIERPLLIKKRKFDIRCYGLFSTVNGIQKGYFYNDGYIRTSCKEYNTNNLNNKFIHLTNDAIQKRSDDYGKFENGNKLSFKEFQKYLDANFASMNIDFYRDMLPQIKKLTQDTFRAVYGKLDAEKRMQGFEVFGYDFMIDEDFRIYLIEVNTNPCLETSCPLLARIISELVENSLRIAFDPLFYHTLVNNQQTQTPLSQDISILQRQAITQSATPGQTNNSLNKKQNLLGSISDLTINLIKYELVFDEKVDGPFLREKVLSKTQIDPNDNQYLQDDDEEADKQEEDNNNNEISQEEQTPLKIEGDECEKLLE